MTNTQTTETTTIVVRMAGIGETWTMPNVPSSLAPLVHDLEESGILLYGPSYSRQAAEAVRDASRFLGWGDVEAAGRYLRNAWARIPQKNDQNTDGPIFAERTPDGLVDLDTGRPLREIIPAGYTCAGSHNHAGARVIRYWRFDNHADRIIVIARDARR